MEFGPRFEFLIFKLFLKRSHESECSCQISLFFQVVLFFELLYGASYTSYFSLEASLSKLTFRLSYRISVLWPTMFFQCSNIWLASILSCLIRETFPAEPNTICLRLSFPGRCFYSTMFSAYNNTHHIIIHISFKLFSPLCVPQREGPSVYT